MHSVLFGFPIELLYCLKEDRTEFLKERGKVRVVSKNSDEEQCIWELGAGGP